MARHKQKQARKYMYPGQSCPVLYEDDRLVVFTNGSGEVFIQNTNPENVAPGIRVGPGGTGEELIITSHNGIMTPGVKNGCPAIRVVPLGMVIRP